MISLRKHLFLNWSEFLRQLSLLILLNRSNDELINNQLRRGSIPPHLSNALIVSRSRFPSLKTDIPIRMNLSNSYTPTPNFSCDEPFRKHAKVLEKLNQRYQQEEIRKKQMGSEVSYTIVESIDEEEDIKLPKLKINARDGRRVITDPWASVKEIEQLRNQPIFVKTTQFKILHPLQ